MGADRVLRFRVVRALLASMLALFAAGLLSAPARAATPTFITGATPMLASLVPSVNVANGFVLARLIDGTGGPVAGKTLTFSAKGSPECNSTTDGNGWAWCKFSFNGMLNSILAYGYQIGFAGDADFLATSARGPLVSVLGIGL
jgi:hypothetical protein